MKEQGIDSLLSLVIKGGWIMIPIIILSIITIFIIIDRLIALKKATNTPIAWIEEVESLLYLEDVRNIKKLCNQRDTAVQRMIGEGIEHLEGIPKNIEVALENAGKKEIHTLEKNLAILGTIAGVAPMMGFLGTVIGMIQTFMVIAQETNRINPQLLAGGIYQAMITTTAGLIVGIISYLGYNYLIMRIENVSYHLECTANEFLELCKLTKKPK